MNFTLYLFYIFSFVLISSSLVVVSTRNMVIAVIFLILAFFNVAGLFVLLGAEYLAMLLVVVYVGAIAVLFLFVVMMLNIKLAEINEKKLRYLPIGGLLGLLFLFEVLVILENDLIPLGISANFQAVSEYTPLEFFDWGASLETFPNIQALGNVMYTYYFSWFLLASLILLVAMIGAIVLTMQKAIGMKRQQVFVQNTRDFAKTLRKFQ